MFELAVTPRFNIQIVYHNNNDELFHLHTHFEHLKWWFMDNYRRLFVNPTNILPQMGGNREIQTSKENTFTT